MKRVGAHEAAYQGVVDAPVHVNDAHLVQVLVLGKSALGGKINGVRIGSEQHQLTTN